MVTILPSLFAFYKKHIASNATANDSLYFGHMTGSMGISANKTAASKVNN